MTNQEIHITFILNIILTLRMLGIFMILPILNNYGLKLIGANELLLGIAMGIYGIMQIIFQIPYGLISDIIGRKPVIIIGLLISAIGTSIAAITNNIWGVIFGRSLQGSSAITPVMITLLSDLIQQKNTTKALISIGLNFSITFAISIIISPIITEKIGLHGLFFSITLLTLLAIVLSLYCLPDAIKTTKNNKFSITNKYNLFWHALTHTQLIKLNFSIFCLHTILIFNFIALPKIMTDFNLLPIQESKIYFISITISLIISTLITLCAEKQQKIKQLLIISIYILLFSEITFLNNNNQYYLIFFSILLFFISFNTIEGILPSILIKITPKTHKGTITGIYSTSQFLGITCGGIFGGYLLEQHNITILFYSGIILIILWLITMTTLYEPKYITNLYIPLSNFKYSNNTDIIIDVLYSKPGMVWAQTIQKNNIIHIIINTPTKINYSIMNNITQNNKKL